MGIAAMVRRVDQMINPGKYFVKKYPNGHVSANWRVVEKGGFGPSFRNCSNR